ncbi:hypothetical protein IGI04_004976 [Brassica rapa subsp. trilocularis]|uniref:TIR domain-containing protein n=1 Tax=Brassica rapa subsp. trilocularis TaxID=1813537 RepID=A0ABQ7NCQ4_BRACM|nr:hypothetical protein IGI04_004976 [Brassica rapa subsp. trilocularis]
MKCKEEKQQKVIPIFYKVDPSDIKKQTGHFGKTFEKSCVGKTEGVTQAWRKALKDVPVLAGYDSSNWQNEAELIEKIAVDLMDVLGLTPSTDFDDLVGMETRMEEINSLLDLTAGDDVKIIGIVGPAGIGKTSTARALFNKFSRDFQFSTFIEDIRGSKEMPSLGGCLDQFQLGFKNKLLSRLFNQNIEIFCQYAFLQKSPFEGFEELAWEVTRLAGNLPLGLRIMGASLRGKTMDEWMKAMPSLRSSLDSKIESILMFGYNGLPHDKDRALFLYIACFFVGFKGTQKVLGIKLDTFEAVESQIRCRNLKKFPNVPESIVELDLCRTGIEEIPSRIENLSRLRKLIMYGCTKLKTISPNISKLENLEFLGLRFDCFCEYDYIDVDNEEYDDIDADLFEARIEWGPDMKRSWTLLSSDFRVHHILPICLPEKTLTSPISLRLLGNGFKTIPDCIGCLSGLSKLDITECIKLVALPPLPGSLLSLDAKGCTSLKRIHCSFQNPNICLNFANCSNLNQKARKLIQTSVCKYAFLPGEEVPAHYTHRASSRSLTINFTPRSLPSSFRFKACILLSKGNINLEDHNDDDDEEYVNPLWRVSLIRDDEKDENSGMRVSCHVSEVPAHFTHRSVSGSLMINLTPTPLPSSFRFKACILLSIDNDEDNEEGVPWRSGGLFDRRDGDEDENLLMCVSYRGEHNGLTVSYGSNEHDMPYLYGFEDRLYIFEDSFRLNHDFHEAEEAISSNLVFQFEVFYKKWRVKGCGVQLLEVIIGNSKALKALIDVIQERDFSTAIDAAIKSVAEPRANQLHQSAKQETNPDMFSAKTASLINQKRPRTIGMSPKSIRTRKSLDTQIERVNQHPRIERFGLERTASRPSSQSFHPIFFSSDKIHPSPFHLTILASGAATAMEAASVVYHLSSAFARENEAGLINKIAVELMSVLGFTPSKDFDDFVGIGARIIEIKSKFILQSEEVKVIMMVGPAGIGKTTTARVLYNQLSPGFPFSTFLENIRGSYEKPCGNDYQLNPESHGILSTRYVQGRVDRGTTKAQPLHCLMLMDLSSSWRLRKIPDLSKATSLEKLDLSDCRSLLELTSSIGSAAALELHLRYSAIEELPSSISTNLEVLDITGCKIIKDFPNVPDSIVELVLSETGIEEVPPWIENLFRLRKLDMHGCERLKIISPNISKLENLEFLALSNVYRWVEDLDFFFQKKEYCDFANYDEAIIKWGSEMKRRWRLETDFDFDYILPICLPERALTSPISLRFSHKGFTTIPDCINHLSGLTKLDITQCSELVALPPLPGSLLSIDAHGCESLKSIDSSSFQNPNICLDFAKCFNLNQEARRLIQTSSCKYALLPGEEVPAHFTHQATSGCLTINMAPTPLPSFLRFKACILLTNDGDDDEDENSLSVDFPEAEEATFSELFFEFTVRNKAWKVKGCGVRLLEEVTQCILDGKETEDEECRGINIEASNENAGGEDKEKEDDDDDEEEEDDDDEVDEGVDVEEDIDGNDAGLSDEGRDINFEANNETEEEGEESGRDEDVERMIRKRKIGGKQNSLSVSYGSNQCDMNQDLYGYEDRLCTFEETGKNGVAVMCGLNTGDRNRAKDLTESNR